MIRAAVWAALLAAVVLVARVVLYSLAPVQTVTVERLEHKAGGPHLATVLASSVAIAVLLAAAVLWLAAVAVRERLALERRTLVSRPTLPLARIALRALLLFVAACMAFAYFESYLHWREGLGWHGFHCITGPVHRDAIPFLAAFSLLAVALHAAGEHLLAWARRIVALLAGSLPVLRGAARSFVSNDSRPALRVAYAFAPRGPPVGSRSAI